jgi:hypothetical protein
MNLFQHTGERRFSLHALMNFVDLTVYNSSGAEFTNINAGGVDVAAGASVTATLTAAEALAVAQLNGAVVMQNAPSAAELTAAAALLAQGTDIETEINEYQRAVASGISLHVDAAKAVLDARGF